MITNASGGSILGAASSDCFGASSPIRGVVSHRLQSAERQTEKGATASRGTAGAIFSDKIRCLSGSADS